MKKILLITISILLGMFSFVNETTAKFLISFAIPRASITDKRIPNHVAILNRGNLSRAIFKKSTETKKVENLVENKEFTENEGVEEYMEPNYYEITLDWSTMLKNLTTYKIDIEKLLEEKLNFKLNKNGIEAVIYHTHTSESYTPSREYMYEASGVFRTLNNNANMVKIGEQIKKELQKFGIGVYHDVTIYDHPDYNSSYSKAGKGIAQTLNKYKNSKIVLDVHRDAIGVNTEQYKPVVKIDGKNVAQFMLVVGTNQGGLSHPNWKENLKLALKIKKLADQKYPGLCRYVILRKERFNQQVSNGAMIVEMGATGNTVEEVLETSKYFSELLVEVCK